MGLGHDECIYFMQLKNKTKTYNFQAKQGPPSAKLAKKTKQEVSIYSNTEKGKCKK